MQKIHSPSPIGPTVRIACTNVATTLEAAGLSMADRPDGALVTCESNDVRFAFNGTVPVPSGVGHILAEGDYIYLGNGREATSVQFVNSVAGANGVIQVTLLKY